MNCPALMRDIDLTRRHGEPAAFPKSDRRDFFEGDFLRADPRLRRSGFEIVKPDPAAGAWDRVFAPEAGEHVPTILLECTFPWREIRRLANRANKGVCGWGLEKVGGWGGGVL